MPRLAEKDGRTTAYIATAKLWLAPDGQVYEDGDQPNGSTLLATPGKSLSNDQVEQYGLGKRQVKADEPAEDKAEDAPENKGRALSTQAVKVTPVRRAAPKAAGKRGK